MKIDKNITMKSSQYAGYLILKYFKITKKQKFSIYEVYNLFLKKKEISLKQMKFGMIFLYSVGIIEFSEANIWIIE